MTKLAAIKEELKYLPLPSKGVNRTTFTIPSGSKNSPEHIINIDTNVKVSTITSMCSLAYLLPRFNICILLTSVIIFMMALNTVQNQMIQLKDTILIIKHEVELAIKDYDDLRRNLEDLTQRCDEMTPRKRVKRLRYMVERDVVSTVGYDEMTISSTDVTRSSLEPELVAVPDSGQKDTNQSIVLLERDQVQLPKLDLLSLTNDQKDVFSVQRINVEEGSSFMNQTDESMYSDAASPEVIDDVFLVNSRSEDNDTSLDDYGSPRSGRAKRSNGRGKQETQNQKGLKKSCNKKNNMTKKRAHEGKGICAIHFMGAKPEIDIRDGGSLVAPWFLDDSAAGTFGLSNRSFNLREGRGVVELTDAGLYYIYAQVYYLTTERTNSFIIKLRRQDKSEVSVATCSVNAAINIAGDSTEVTCFTSIVYYMNAGDQIYLQQQERDRHVLMKEGQTFLGLVRLHSEKLTQQRS